MRAQPEHGFPILVVRLLCLSIVGGFLFFPCRAASRPYSEKKVLVINELGFSHPAIIFIVQSALRNVKKHTGAKQAHIELTNTGAEMRLLKSDQGAGFGAKRIRSAEGSGLQSGSERYRIVGGHFAIRSEPRIGTRIEAVVPLERETSVIAIDSIRMA